MTEYKKLELLHSQLDELIQDPNTSEEDKKWYENFKEVMDIILEYHNNYGKYHKHAKNWYDWIMIIPINVSVMTNGFFAGLETKKNAAQIRAYKILLNEKVQEVVDKLEKLDIK